jgi:hypothetical protein
LYAVAVDEPRTDEATAPEDIRAGIDPDPPVPMTTPTEGRMTHAHTTRFARLSVLALLGAAALTGAACRSAETVAAAAPASATPVAVNCGPGQQALIRPGVAAGQAISQVDCVAVAVAGAAAVTPGMATLEGDPRLTPIAYQQPAAPAVVYRPAQTVRAPAHRVQRGRSVKKSALIIGSSAGIGAGVGAAVKGKKGALIGAALGGGAATIWDQITRRDR